MLFKEKGWVDPNLSKYHEENVKLAREYSKQVFKEFGGFVKAIVLFGSLSKNTLSPGSDIDLLTVVDDTAVEITKEVLDAYEIINQRIILDVSPKLHVNTVTLTGFWDYARQGDPVMYNILRDGVVLIDSNFVIPMQKMLLQGRVRPSPEAVYNYVLFAPQAVNNANLKLLQAYVDLYWCAADITQAYLMSKGEVPPSPEHFLDLMSKYKVFSKQDKELFKTLYTYSRDISHRKKNYVSGVEFEGLRKNTIKYFEKIKKEIGI